MSKKNPYELPESIKIAMATMQKVAKPYIETQEKIRNIILSSGHMSGSNDIINAANNTFFKTTNFAELDNTVRNLIPTLETLIPLHEPLGLAEIYVSRLMINTPALQITDRVNSIFNSNRTSSIERILDSYSAISQRTFDTSPLLSWLNSIDIPLLTQIWESLDIDGLFKNQYERYNHLHLSVMYKAKWFPYAYILSDGALFNDIDEIILSSRIGEDISRNCEQRIDRVVKSYYTPKEIKRLKKDWGSSDIEPHLKKILKQALDAYLRGEYALVIPVLATMWEGMIHSKSGGKTKDKIKELVDKNGYDKVLSDFYIKMIFSQCYSKEDVVEGIPNRHGVAHSWYVAYPSKKAALNAILLTDFLLKLEPIVQEYG